MSFSGRNAVVTGSSKGIGRAVALELGRQGANVTVNYRSGKDDAEEVASQIRDAGGKALVVHADVADRDSVQNMIAATVQEFGSLDLFVSNAAYSDRQLMVDAELEGFEQTINVTMWGAFYGVRAASQQMVRQGTGGAITVISSPHAVIPFPTAMAYNMSKAAIDHMARTAATELLEHQVRVNIFHPGWIDTPGERKFFTEEQIAEGAKKMPMKRLGTPEEMAKGIVFTLSDDAAYMNGATLSMDGGLGLAWWSNRSGGEM